MAGGKASDRLNTILSQGSSVKADSVTSVLEKGTSDAESLLPLQPKVTPIPVNPRVSAISSHADDDPDTSDIEQLLSHRVSPVSAPKEQDIDEMLNKMFGGAGEEDPIQSMMMNMMKQQQSSAGESTADPVYEADLLKYNVYQQKALKFRFLIIRMLSVVINFFYHFYTVDNFKAASYSYIRQAIVPKTNFTVVFMTIEMVILSSYYVINNNRKMAGNVSEDNFLLKIVSMASMVLPMVQNFQPVITQAVKYYEILSMFLGDLALVVFLFGITSV